MTMLHNYKAEGDVLRLFELVIYFQFQRILYNSNVLINPRNNQDVATIRRTLKHKISLPFTYI